MSQNLAKSYWLSNKVTGLKRQLARVTVKIGSLFIQLNDQLPPWLLLGVLGLCVIPTVLMFFGVSFAAISTPLNPKEIAQLDSAEIAESIFKGMRGSFIHTILEWSAVSTAVFTSILSLAYLRHNEGIVVPVLGITLFFSGTMDAFHVLASDRLVGSLANIADFISFTWILSRSLNGLVMILGVVLFESAGVSQRKDKLMMVVVFASCLGLLGYGLIRWATLSPTLPTTTFPKAWIRRPYEVLPALIYGIGGIFVFTRHFDRNPGLFSAGLVLGIFPNIAAQLHMSFGYQQLFDSHFNVGHFLKVVGYSVPFIALVLDYSSTYSQLSISHRELAVINDRLNGTYMRLNMTNQELAIINEQLEEKVSERTHELASAYHQIAGLNEQLEQENYRLATEIDIARRIQEMILPKAEELQIHDLDIVGFMEPADEVGGDYFDVLDVNGVVTIGIGDVTGHGLESGMLMLMAQTAVRTLKEMGEQNPIQFLHTINMTLYKNVIRMNSDKSLSLSVLNYANGVISISGQHEEVIVVRQGKLERIDTADLGFPIGLCEEISEFINHLSIDLSPGDGVFLFTDGITEAEDIEHNMYGIDRLCEVVLKNWHRSAEEIKLAVIKSIKNFIGTQKVFDDITFVVFKRKGVTIKPRSLPSR